MFDKRSPHSSGLYVAHMHVSNFTSLHSPFMGQIICYDQDNDVYYHQMGMIGLTRVQLYSSKQVCSSQKVNILVGSIPGERNV